MILRVKELGLSLEVDDELMKNLVVDGKGHYPNEFGGFLIGYYQNEDRHVVITNSILPISFKATKFSFERSTNGIESELKRYFTETPQQFYVGEWHTHPDNRPIPSAKDLRALKVIVEDENAGISNPILLIIGCKLTDAEFGFYVMVNNKIYKYE